MALLCAWGGSNCGGPLRRASCLSRTSSSALLHMPAAQCTEGTEELEQGLYLCCDMSRLPFECTACNGQLIHFLQNELGAKLLGTPPAHAAGLQCFSQAAGYSGKPNAPHRGGAALSRPLT